MKTFLQLNKDKLTNTFGRLSLILLGFISIVILIAYVSGILLTFQLLLPIILLTVTAFPLFIMFLGYIGWQINNKARRNAFSKVPFNDIENIGFYKFYINDTSKFSFRDEIKKGHFNGFTLLMDVSKEKGHTLEFEMLTQWRKLSKQELSVISQKFKEHNIDFRIGSLVKQYDTKQSEFLTISDLKQDLDLTTAMLISEGFLPKT